MCTEPIRIRNDVFVSALAGEHVHALALYKNHMNLSLSEFVIHKQQPTRSQVLELGANKGGALAGLHVQELQNLVHAAFHQDSHASLEVIGRHRRHLQAR